MSCFSGVVVAGFSVPSAANGGAGGFLAAIDHFDGGSHPNRVRTVALPTSAAAFFPKQNSRGSNDSMYDCPGPRSSPRLSGNPDGRIEAGTAHLYTVGFFFGCFGSLLGTSISNESSRTSAGTRIAFAPSLSMRIVHASRGPGAITHNLAATSGGGGTAGTFAFAGAFHVEVAFGAGAAAPEPAAGGNAGTADVGVAPGAPPGDGCALCGCALCGCAAGGCALCGLPPGPSCARTPPAAPRSASAIATAPDLTADFTTAGDLPCAAPRRQPASTTSKEQHATHHESRGLILLARLLCLVP